VRRNTRIKIVTKTLYARPGGFLEFEVGTTGLRGGDTGHGGRTFLRIGNDGASDMRVEAGSDGVTLVCGGDLELEALIDGLRSVAEVLEQSREEGTRAELYSHRNVD
jgi:hypothetical protein